LVGKAIYLKFCTIKGLQIYLIIVIFKISNNNNTTNMKRILIISILVCIAFSASLKTRLGSK
jgi:hypothetical protein